MILLYQGDSVTSGKRVDDHDLGNGYVNEISKHFNSFDSSITVLNRAIGGNKSIDLVNRWQTDALDIDFDVITIMVGVNDTWHYYDGLYHQVSRKEFRNNYEKLLEPIVKKNKKIIILGSYLYQIDDKRDILRPDLDEKIDETISICNDYKLPFVDVDKLFNSGVYGTAEQLTLDSIHPSYLGNVALKNIWLNAYANLLIK